MMKKAVLLIVSLLLLLSSCTTPHLDPVPPSESGESSADYPKSPLSQEALSEIKTHFETEFRKKTSEQYFLPISKETYLSTLESFSLNPNAFLDEEFYKMIAYDATIENYHSAQISEQLQQGMMLNEVVDILGAPHFNATFRFINGVMIGPENTYDFCTMYLLNDGRFLVLRYTPVFIGEIGRQELQTRVPEFDTYEKYDKVHENYRWGQLLSYEILTEEELLAIPFGDEYLRTAEEHKPQDTTSDKLSKVQINMSYSEVKALLGSSGFDYIYRDGKYTYFWVYENGSSYKMTFKIEFELTDSGELIVSQIVSQIT